MSSSPSTSPFLSPSALPYLNHMTKAPWRGQGDHLGRDDPGDAV